jgi:hypothetical protein
MRIQTANIIVSTDGDLLTRAISEGTSYAAAVKSLAEEGALLFDSNSNPNFLSFTTTMLEGKSQGELKFIDPRQEFEARFLTNSVSQNLSRITPKIGEREPDLADGLSNQDTSNSLKDIKDLSEKKKAGLQKQRDLFSIYIAFGTGDSFDDWSAPMKYFIEGISLDVSKARQITLTLAHSPQDISGGGNQINQLSNDIVLQGRSKPILFENEIKNDVDHAKVYTPWLTPLEDQSKDQKLDIHYLVCDTIKSLAQNATRNKNVIVLLPNIQKYCSRVLQESRELSLIDNPTSKTTRNYIGGLAKSEVASINQDKQLKRMARLETFLDSALGNFGMTITQLELAKANLAALRLALPPGTIQPFVNAEKAPATKERLEQFYNNRQFYATIDVANAGSEPDGREAIMSVLDSVRSSMNGDYLPKWTFYTENNLYLTNLWASLAEKYPLFKDIEKDSPVTVIGDQELISKFLFGDLDLQDSDSDSTDDFKFLLSTVDYLTIASNKFNKATRKASRRVRTISDIPDEFAYVGFSEEDARKLREDKVPIFRYNTENPNILKIISQQDNAYYVGLMSVAEKNNTRMQRAVAQGNVPEGYATLPETVSGEEAEYAVIKQQIEQAAAYPSPSILISQDRPTTPAQIMESLVKEVNQTALQVEIETLPYFYISGYSNLFREVFLFVQDTPIIQTRVPESTDINKYFSGSWLISSMTHTIDGSGKAKSSFKLIRKEANQEVTDEEQ